MTGVASPGRSAYVAGESRSLGKVESPRIRKSKTRKTKKRLKIQRAGHERFVLEIWIRTAATERQTSRIMDVLEDWMSELYRALPLTWLGRYLRFWVWGNIVLNIGETPEEAHKELLAKLRKIDPQLVIVSRWGEFIDKWLYTFEDPPPDPSKKGSDVAPVDSSPR